MQIGLYADDAVFYGVIKDCKDAKSLQQDLNILVHWADTWQMSSDTRNLHLNTNTPSTEKPFQAVDHYKYLGVELSSDLNWDVHICWYYRQSQQLSWLYKKKPK